MKHSLEHQLNLHIEFGTPHPPFREEHSFYDIVARGDTEGILELKRKYGHPPQGGASAEKGRLSDDPLRNAVYHLVVNCTIITRSCISAGMPQEQAYTLSDLFIRRADQCHSISEVEELNDDIAMEFASRMKKLNETPAVSPAVRNAINFICDHIGERLTADRIAAETGYNRSYLSALFIRETGSSISRFILDKRIETAKSMIDSGTGLSETASALGFASQSHFCERFKKATEMSPKQYKYRR